MAKLISELINFKINKFNISKNTVNIDFLNILDTLNLMKHNKDVDLDCTIKHYIEMVHKYYNEEVSDVQLVYKKALLRFSSLIQPMLLTRIQSEGGLTEDSSNFTPIHEVGEVVESYT